MFGIFVKTNGVGELKYTLTDHLGSLTGVVNATTGNVEHSVSFDAWGKPRSADWKSDYSGSLFADRGFTGHEHLPSAFGLIDMNGRMYDPVLGRFLSPDPYVQDAGYSQSFNRYSYCLNNPLLYTDPSGYVFDPITWTVIGGVLLFTYLKSAYDNKDPQTGKWDWNMSNTFSKDGQFQIGISTNTDGSSWSMYGGYGNGEYMPMIGYNNNYGMGMGYGDNNGSHMYYPNQTKQMTENDKIVSGKFDEFVGNNSVDYISEWLLNNESWTRLNISTTGPVSIGFEHTILGVGLGVQLKVNKERKGVITTNGDIQSLNSNVKSLNFQYGFVGGEVEWRNKRISPNSFDFSILHFERGQYPTFRVYEGALGGVAAGGSVNVDLNTGRIINRFGESQLYYYNHTGRVPNLYGF